MSGHVDDELYSLLSGELGREETAAVVAHLRECGECTSELVSVAVAFGSLRAARRTAEALGAPSREATAPLAALDGAEQPALRLPAARHRRWAALAAAVVLVVAAATGIVLATRSSAPPVYASAVLHHMDAPASAVGHVTVRTTSLAQQMSVQVEGLPRAPADHYYEVWLLAPSTNKMLPVGLLSPTGQGKYAVAPSIMAQYSAVDISLQANDGNPAHSATSVLRGSVVVAS